MALAGAGVYALVVPGMLVTAPFIYDLFIQLQWRPDWRWDRRRYAAAFKFGLSRTASGLTMTLRPLLEQSLIVHALGYASAGFLTRGMGLAAIFCQRPAMQLMYAIYPVMTRIEPGTERYRRMSALIIRIVTWTAVPAAALFAILAEPVVELVYGSKWTAVTPLLPWALLASALGALQHTLYMLLLAHEGARTCLVGDALALLGVGLSLALLLPSGLAAYLGGLCAVQSLVTLFLVERLKRAGGLDLSGLGMAVGPALVAIAVAVTLTHQGFAILGLNEETAAGAVLFGAVTSALYLTALRLFFLRQLNDLLAHLPGVNNAMRRFFMLETVR
jgi:PST family polysaccharide transporter